MKLINEISSGVVLVQNQSYYEVVLSNGESIYFSTLDEDNEIKGFATEEDSVEVVTSYGTGFFISNEGQIATNAHVVSNTLADRDINQSVSLIFRNLRKVFKQAKHEYDEEYEKASILYNYANYSEDISYETFYKIRDYREQVGKERDKCSELLDALDDLRAEDSEIKYHNEVSIAYNNTFVTNTKDFIIKTDPDHDLAIIQLKDKKNAERQLCVSSGCRRSFGRLFTVRNFVKKDQ